MTKNVGYLDMGLRVALAAALFYVGFVPNPIVTSGTSQLVLGCFGFVPLLTALLRWCPLYSIIGMSTCPRPDDR